MHSDVIPKMNTRWQQRTAFPVAFHSVLFRRCTLDSHREKHFLLFFPRCPQDGSRKKKKNFFLLRSTVIPKMPTRWQQRALSCRKDSAPLHLYEIPALAGVAQWTEFRPATQAHWFSSWSGHLHGLRARKPTAIN